MLDFDAAISVTLDLTKTLRIRRITKEEKFYSFEDQNGETKQGRGLGGGNEGRLFFVADCASYGNPRFELDRLATLLLLFRRETDDGNLPTFSTEFGGKGALGSAQLPPIDRGDIDPGHNKYPGYFLRANELKPFLVFWSNSTSGVWHANLVPASRRLIRMQSRRGTDSLEDRLIDSMIAFEALLLKRDDDKGPTIAHRTAQLLGDSNGQVKRKLKLAYECRNDLVHDGQVSKEKLTRIGTLFERFVSQIEGDLRCSMVKYIELMNNGCSKKTILRQLGSHPIKRKSGR
jgi:hypothetical protein